MNKAMKMKKGILVLALLLCAFVSIAQRTRVVKPGGGGVNLYNTSDTLTSDRDVDLNGYRLVIKTDSVASDQTGLELRPGLYNEFANHWPLVIGAGPRGSGMDSIGFGSYDSNLAIYTNTNGLRYGTDNTFTNPRHIIDKQYCDANVSGATGPGNGGIYEGDGYLPENVRASGGPLQRSMTFDSVGLFEVKDWNTGQALRVWQDINSAAGKGFGRLITASVTDDSLDISHTDGLVFDITATKPIHFYTSELKYFGNSFNLDFGSSGQIADLRGTKTGLQYLTDYSSSFVARSLVDKAYVDNAVSGAGATAKYCVVGDQTETVQSVNGSGAANWEIFPTATQVANAGSVFSFNTSTDRITYTTATSGHVRIWFHFSFTSNNLANEFNVSIKKNGTETRAKSSVMVNETGINFAGSGETYITVAQNDYFEIGGYFTGSTGNMTLHELMWGVEFIGQ